MGWLVTAADAACLVALAAALLVAAACDLRSRIISNGCAAVVAGSGLLRAVAHATLGGAGVRPVLTALLGAAVVLLVMVAAALASAWGGRERGVGGGDVKLLAAAGSWTGPVLGLVTVGLSCLVGVAGWFAYRVVLALRGGQPPRPGIPLAPSIALATLAVVLVGVL